MTNIFFPTIYETIKNTTNLISTMGIENSILILTHIDADGLSAASIIAKLLHSLDKPFVIKPINQIRKDILEEINEKNQPEDLIILDMGSGDIEALREIFKNTKKTLIIDHHIPKSKTSFITQNKNFILFNPWLYGYNGSNDISTSGLSFLVTYPFIKKINKLEKTIVNAIVGATGDSQDNGGRGEFTSLNKQIVEIGKQIGLVEELVDIAIYRRESKPLYKALAESYNIEIPGITGNEESALNFLKNIGIIKRDEDKEKTLADLSNNEKIKLTDEIISRLVFSYSDKLSVEEIKNMIMTTIYIFPQEKKGPTRNNKEYAGLLNACGKLGHPEIGLAIALGDRKKLYEQGVKLFNSYQDVISDLLEKATESVEKDENVIIIKGQDWLDENLTSTISSIISYSRKIDKEGIIIVIGKSTNGYLKISFRLTPGLRGKINLRELIEKATTKIPHSTGGGHDVAAGAYVPEDKIEDFLEIIKNIVSKL